MQVDYQKEFLKFLKEKDIEDKFKVAVENDPINLAISLSFDEVIQLEVKGRTPDEIVKSAFVWYKTPEGRDYWDVIDDQWREKCEELECK